MTEDVLEDVKISFSVDKDWLSENGLQSTEIALFRYVDEQWVQLETTVVAVNGEYSYEAITPGFSYFMIAETDQAISSLVVEEAVVIEPEVDGSLIEVIDSDLGLVDAEESLLVDEGFDSKKLIRKIFPSLNSLYFTIMGLMILMIVITSIVLYRRSKEEFDEYSAVGRKDVVEMSKEVRSAVNDALIRAARKRKIKRRLKKEIDYNLDHK